MKAPPSEERRQHFRGFSFICRSSGSSDKDIRENREKERMRERRRKRHREKDYLSGMKILEYFQLFNRKTFRKLELETKVSFSFTWPINWEETRSETRNRSNFHWVPSQLSLSYFLLFLLLFFVFFYFSFHLEKHVSSPSIFGVFFFRYFLVNDFENSKTKILSLSIKKINNDASILFILNKS